MHQHARTKDIKVANHDYKIEDEVPRREGLHHGCRTSITPDSLLEIHAASLLIYGDDREGTCCDEATRHHTGAMHVPSQLTLLVQSCVVLWKEMAREWCC